MGLFGKLKDRMSTGGVKVELNAPPTISVAQPAIEIQVILSSEEHKELKNVYAGLRVCRTTTFPEANSQFGVGGGGTNRVGSSQNNTRIDTFEVARAELGPFTVEPMEAKKFAVTLPMDELRRFLETGNAAKVELGEGIGINIAEKLVQSVVTGGVSYHDSYDFFAGAEMDEHRDPTASESVHITEASNQGGGFGFKPM